jgi:hypothetical protein
MSEYALERARAKARRRVRKPRGPKSPGPLWPSVLWLVTLVIAYVRAGLDHSIFLALVNGAAAIIELHSVRRRLAWWRWERREGVAHPPADRWDQVFAVLAAVILLSNLLWLAGAP